MGKAVIVVAGVVMLSGCDTAPDVAGVDASSGTRSLETTGAPATTAPSTAPPATAAASADPSLLVIDRLFDAFNAQDAEAVADVFGDDVVYVLRDTNEEFVGTEAAAFWQGYFGRETGERTTGPFPAPDGRTYFVGVFASSSGGSATLVFDVEMDGERLISMGDRPQKFDEATAVGEIDDLHEAFNDQDVDRLTSEFEGVTYISPSSVEFTGSEAAERWANAFGSVVTRTSGVFAIGDGAYRFLTEHREPDSGRSTSYAVEVEMSGGQITRMTERRPQN
jgi:hypothetical protein